MKKELLGLALSASLVSGCAQKAPEMPVSSITMDELYNTGRVTQVELGQTAFVGNLDETSREAQRLLREIEMVDHQYPEGPSDDKAPIITNKPARLIVQVTLQGKSPELANDAACDTLRVDGDPKYVSAVAIGGKERGVMISRPAANPGYVYVCSFQHMEPSSDKGVIFFTSSRDR